MKIKALDWRGNHDPIYGADVVLAFWAKSPSSHLGGLTINFEEGLYWPSWDASLPGYATVEEAMAKGQEFHDAYIAKFLDADEPVDDLFTDDMQMRPEAINRSLTLTFRIGYAGSRVSDLMIGKHRVQIDNDLIKIAMEKTRG